MKQERRSTSEQEHPIPSLPQSSALGQPLDDATRAALEPRFRHNFANVRVYSDAESDRMARGFGANAFTSGEDVYFAQGLYQPDTPVGMKLLAHELTHTMQQTKGQVTAPQSGLAIDPSPSLENEARDNAERALEPGVMISSALSSSQPPASSGVVQRSKAGEDTSPEMHPGAVVPALREEMEGGVVVQRDPIAGQSAQSAQPSVNDRLSQVEKEQANLKKRIRAGEIDDAARSVLLRKLAESSQAVFRLTQGFQRGKSAFEATQAEQARSDAIRNQILMMLGTSVFAWAFEPAAGLLGKYVSVSEKSIERWENVFNAVVSGTANTLGQNAQNQTAIKGATPAPGTASGVSGDPLVFLTANLETVSGFVGRIESAFSGRKSGYAQATSEQWDKYDPAAHQAMYKPIVEEVEKLVKLDGLKSADELSKILEKHLWAAWIKTSSIPITKGYGPSKDKKLEERSTEDFDDVAMSLGSEVEDKLNSLGISASAGVVLSGHWYSKNAPDNWHARLYVWARDYAEKISSI